jgi:hypothetical protein
MAAANHLRKLIHDPPAVDYMGRWRISASLETESIVPGAGVSA